MLARHIFLLGLAVTLCTAAGRDPIRRAIKEDHVVSFFGARSGQKPEDLHLPLAKRSQKVIVAHQGEAVMSANASQIGEDGNLLLTVSFPGGYQPTPDDYLMVSCGPVQSDADLLDQINILDSATMYPLQVILTGLAPMRCTYNFTYVGVLAYYPNIVYRAMGGLLVDMERETNAPSQIHLAYLNDPTTMMVTFTSGSPTQQYVEWWQVNEGIPQRAEMTMFTYQSSDLCHDPANETSQQWGRDPGYIHTGTMTGLIPSTKVMYRVGSDSVMWSKNITFNAAPKPAASQKSIFYVFGDQGTSPQGQWSSTMIAQLAKVNQVDYVLHIGDLGYAIGHAWQWDVWGEQISEGARHIPYMVSVGNHEMDYDRGMQHDPSHQPPFQPTWWNNGNEASAGECGFPTFARFHAPSNGNGIFWYYMTYGNVFVIQMSSEHNFTIGSPQWNWVQQTLSAVDRTVYPWVAVTMHRPIYTTQECETGDYVVALHLRKDLDALFAKYKVNIAFVAHTHAYERTCPLLYGQCVGDGQGTVHVTTGGAGAGLESCGYSTRYGNFSMSRLNGWGITRVEATETHLHVTFQLTPTSVEYDHVVVPRWT